MSCKIKAAEQIVQYYLTTTGRGDEFSSCNGKILYNKKKLNAVMLWKHSFVYLEHRLLES